MAYVTVEDTSGSIEMLVFQRTLDEWSSGIGEGVPVLVKGRISVRDEKEPQIICSSMTNLADAAVTAAPPQRKDAPESPHNSAAEKPKTLYVRFNSQKDRAYERLKLILIMFPGNEKLVVYFSDTKQQFSTRCVIHPALVKELTEMLGSENVVLK